jgi:hypothetical protein
MDHINEVLTSQCINTSYYAPVCAALAMGKKTLNHYYNLTDSSKVYHIAMGSSHPCFLFYNHFTLFTVLHPCHKLSYFTKAGWEISWMTWIIAAQEIVRAEFDRTYAAKPGVTIHPS